MANSTESRLIISLLDRLTGPATRISATLQRLNAMQERNAASLNRVRGQMLDAVGAGYALAKSVGAPIKAAVAFESSMADVAKVVNFPTPVAFKQMGKDIREMSTRIPIAADGLAQIVAAAGQSGIANDELLKFTELAAKVGVAWDISAGSAGESMAKLKTALGRSIEDTASLADAINHLGNKSAASAPQILEVVKRVAPMASQFGMSAEQVAALGAAMTGSGFESDVAATSIMNIGRALTRGAGATKRQSDAFTRLGLDSKKVAKSMQKDSMGTLQDVLQRVAKLPADMRASLVSDLFGDEARALGPLISNGKLLGDTLGLIGDKSNYAGSAQAEFDQRSKTTANAMQLFGNRVTDLAISVGNALLPALNLVLDKFGPMITSISDLAERYPQLTAVITGATAALVAFRIALTVARFAGLYAVGSAISTGIAFTNMAGVFAIVGGALAAVSAPIWAAIAVAVAAVGAAGLLVWKYWDRLSAIFSGVAAAVGDQLAPALKFIQPVLHAIAPAFRAVGDAAAWVGDKISAVAGWFSKLFTAENLSDGESSKIAAGVRDMINSIADELRAGEVALYNAGVEMIQSLWDGAVAKFDALIAWFKEIPGRIKNAIGNIDLSSMIRLPSFLGGGGDAPATTPAAPTATTSIDGARAAGGPVGAGKTYLVGERGPELFSPSKAGLITPNSAITSVSSRSTPDIQVHATFQITEASNATLTANAIEQRLGAAVKDALEASYGGAAH